MNFRENIPTITGPGAFFIVLVFIALILTSQGTRNFLFNDWKILISFVVFSIPLSIFFNQIYHPILNIWRFRNKKLHKRFNISSKYNYVIDTMIDYLCFMEKKNGEQQQKVWFILQKKSTAFNFISTLLFVSIFFLLLYVIILIVYWSKFKVLNLLGIIFTLIISTFFIIIFILARRSLWETYMILEKKFLNKNFDAVEEWLKEENIIKDNNQE